MKGWRSLRQTDGWKDVNRTISMTFAIGSALAAIAGVLFLSTYTSLTPTTGSMPGIKAFTAAVFGGIGSIPGALLGGLLLGVIETFARAYISTCRDVFFVLKRKKMVSERCSNPSTT